MIEELNARGRHEIGTSGFSALPAGLPGVGAQDAVAEVTAACLQLEWATGRPVPERLLPERRLVRTWQKSPQARGFGNFRTGRRVAPVRSPGHRNPRLIDIGPGVRGGNAQRIDRHIIASPIDHSVRFVLSQMRWDVELRTLAHRCTHAGVGRNVHVRWSLQPGLGHHLDVETASNRFVDVLGVMLSGCERSGASIVPVERLGQPSGC